MTTGRLEFNPTADRSPVAPRHPLLVALGLAAGPATALGLARFAYALLLPAMRSALHWSFATAALMNTANAAGYLVGALVATPAARRLGAKPVFVGGIALTAPLLAGSAATDNLAVLLTLRLLAGTTGAATFVVGGALAAGLGHGGAATRSALPLGVYFGGGGVGIAVSGVVLPVLLTDADGWRWGWVALGIGAGLAALAALPAAIRAPQPAGARRPGPSRLAGLRAILCSYTAYGAGYIAYMTFIVAYLRAGGAGTAEVAAFWAVLGIAAVAGGVAWGPVLGRLAGGRGPALLIGVVMLGAALPLATTAPPVAFASAALFGVSFLAVVAAVTQVARVALPPSEWTAAIARLTTGFALGQGIGPVLSGVLADRSGGIRTGLALSVVILIIAAAGCLAHRRRDHRPNSSSRP